MAGKPNLQQLCVCYKISCEFSWNFLKKLFSEEGSHLIQESCFLNEMCCKSELSTNNDFFSWWN